MTAVFSGCGRYRYRLERTIDESRDGVAVWVMLNPSTADARVDDPTIRRVRHFSSTFDSVGRAVVVNLYAFRSTRPVGLRDADNAQGPGNTGHVCEALKGADHIVVGWGGSQRSWRDSNPSAVLELLRGRRLWCLGETRDGDPCHPLYIENDRAMRPWQLR